MTLGKQFVEVAKGNKTILAEVEEKIRNHKEEVLLTVCFQAAQNGAKGVDIGKCLPPCLEEDEIFFRKNARNTVIAYWA